jgi:GT2 family glycosyltransferase
LPDDALLAEAALFELAAASSDSGDADILFTDEDRVDGTGDRIAPRFKTTWDPELAREGDALGHIAAFRTSFLRRIFVADAAPAQTPFLPWLSSKAGFLAETAAIRHVPAVLCHRLAEYASAPLRTRNPRPVREPEVLVSVIVPTRDHVHLLEQCVEGLLNRTDYQALEILIVDNDSQEDATKSLMDRLAQDRRVWTMSHPGEFNFSAINNRAARAAQGEILLLLNNDIDVIHPDWLTEMVSHVSRPDVGAVGAKLLYADGRIQHAGVVLGPGRNLIHQLRGEPGDASGPCGELLSTRTVSAVTGACMAVRRSVFFEVGCLDENLAIAYNDIDFCMRLGDRGYRIVWTPHAELFHLESASRGADTAPDKHARSLRELDYFCRVWGSLIDRDPFHNPNILYGWEGTTLSAPPRRMRPWMAM